MNNEHYVGEEEDFDEVQTTFGFVDPKPSDALTLSALIPRFVPLNRLEVAQAISHQKIVGTIIKDQDEQGNILDNLYGFTSVLNLGEYSNLLPSIHNFIEWMKKLGDPALNDILDNHIHSTGLIFSERALGVPNELSPHLMRGLFNEINWATEDLETEEERNSFRFTHYIIVKKVIKGDDGLEFNNMEDEFFYKHAQIKVEFTTSGEDGDIDGVEYNRMIIAFDSTIVPIVRNELNEFFNIDETLFEHENHK